MFKQIIVQATLALMLSASLNAQIFEHVLPPLPALQLDADILVEGKPHLFDYDNDGDVDVLINDRIYINEGDIFFDEYIEPDFLPESNDFAHSFDADNDGDLDLLLPVGQLGFGEHSIRLLINDGTGDFTEQTPALFGGIDCYIETGDVDNDGDIDIFATNVFLPDEPYPVTVLYLNNGDNTFTIKETDVIDIFRGQIKLADLDNDSDLDVIIAGKPNGGGHILRTYRNDGNANFTQYMSGLVNLKDVLIETSDIDDDGDQDVVIIGVETTTAKSHIFENNGNGIFTLHQNLSGVSQSVMTTFGGIDLAGSISFGDIDNDGDDDLIIAGATHNTSSSADSYLYINDGTGVFNENTQAILDIDNYAFATFVDLDNDNLIDVFQTTTYLRAHRSFFNQGNSEFKLASGSFINGEIFSASTLIFDVDQDDDQDIFVYGRQGFHREGAITNYHSFFMNDGTGVFTGSGSDLVFNNDTYNSSFVSAVDIDNDGDIDLFAYAYEASQLFINDGSGQLSEEPNFSIPELSFGGVIQFFDYNNDGLPDLLLGSKLYQNTGNNQFSEAFVFPINIEFTNIGDYDNNGFLDVITKVDNTTSVFYNDGQGVFELATDGTFTVDYYLQSDTQKLFMLDFNNDGFLDFIFPHEIFLNNGENLFGLDITNEDVLGNDVILNVVDLDNDNDLDVITNSNYNYFNKIYLNDGTGVLDTGVQFGGGNSGDLFAIDDFDGDLDVDMFVFAHNPVGSFKLYKNTTIVTAANEVFRENKGVDFSVFPNPASQTINLSLLDQDGPFLIKIYNTLGILVFQSSINGADKNHVLDISSLRKGAYFLNLHNEEVSTTKLIVVE